MTGSELRLVVMVVEFLMQVGPGLVEVGANLIAAIRSNGDLTDEQKADLVARVTATRVKVAAYQPRPTPPDPKPTAR